MTGVTDSGFRLARLGLAAAIISRLAGRLIGILLIIVLARVASADTVAVYGYLLGTATLVTMLTDLGVSAIAGREVAAGKLAAGDALRAAFLPQLASALMAAFATVILTVTLGPDAASLPAIAVAVAFVIVGSMVNLWSEVLRATGRVVLEGALQVASAALLAVAGVIVVHMGGGATELLVVVALKETGVLAVATFVVRPARRNRIRSRQLLRQSGWLAIAGTAVILLWRQGTIVVGSLGDVGALAVYIVATRFFDAGVTVAHTAGLGLVPGLSALVQDPAAFKRAARKYVGLAAAVGSIVALTGATLAEPLTTIPFGETWQSAVPSVRVVALSALPIMLCYVCFTVLLAAGRLRWMFAATVAGASVGILVSVALTAHSPTALSAVVGTTVGATVLAVIELIGIRDFLGRGRRERRGADKFAAIPSDSSAW
ncbi:oligosaccharide flippase family protein [Blastococcus sp. TML/M2B]|uniref:lipopolysaccharide biosynthesis protein n=1 Tax=unclassified Blastococcus TaxID=2619396 RepID=UPI00190D09FC|nr:MULTISPECIES: oligosaccharide flippase family protein [unclassified Blastococcus]MBN1091247.1 oligosaccharide flippase family protein [Blastococcus sp. TML/M2B]MBN1095196.1 oligosaccharide flippase family protein [Blastococcus sp. TML/C7B]